MNPGWLARHRAWRMLPVWALATGVNTAFLLGLVFWRAATRQAEVSALTLILVGWVGAATYLAFADVRTRCTAFEMSLPTTPRRLWLNYLTSILGGALIVLGLTLGVITLCSRLAVPIGAGSNFWILAAVLGTGVILATLLLQVPRPSLSRIPLTPGQVGWTVLVLAGTPVLLVIAAGAGWLGLTLLTVLAVGVAFWSYRAVPPAYTLVPLEPSAKDSARYVAAVFVSPPSGLLLPLTVARCVSAGVKELLAFPFVFLFAVVLGGGLLAFEGGSIRELRFLYLPITTYMLFAVTGPRLSSLHYIDALPVPRRPLVAALVLPYFLTVCAGYGVGAWIAADAGSRLEYVNFEEGDDGYYVTVPLRVHALAWDGQPPRVDSAWGESQTAESLPLIKWSRAATYSPYSAPPGSSARFVALQISRAAEAIYGAAISPEAIEKRYLLTHGDGRVVPQGEGLTLRRDYPGLTPRSGPMFPALLTLTVVPWLWLVALLLRAYRAGIREWVRQTIVWGSLVIMLGLVIAASLASFSLMQEWAIRALVEIPVMRLGESAFGTLAAWLVSCFLLAGGYRLAESQFLRMEIPTQPSRYTLIRIGQD